jgi:glycine reductase
MIELAGGLSISAHSEQLAEQGRPTFAEATGSQVPDELENFEIFTADPALPRVVYIAAASLTWHNPHSGLAYYGLPIRESLPTFIHPNEFLDGAITKDMRIGNGSRPTTWSWMSSAVVVELLRQHGKTLNFLGVILQRTRFETEFGKEVTAAASYSTLGADGVISTGFPLRQQLHGWMFTVQACERRSEDGL